MEIKWKIIKTVYWLFLIAMILIGGFTLDSAIDKSKYSTDEYWVARDYEFVYEKYNGQIVNYITKDEECEIKGDVIIVTKTNEPKRVLGLALLIFFGGAAVCTIILKFSLKDE